MFGAILKATNSSFQKGMTFYRSIYVKKVMKLLAFIFEQPSYSLLAEYTENNGLITNICIVLRNEFNFWNVHGVMNTWVSCKVNVNPFWLHLLCKRPEVFMIP